MASGHSHPVAAAARSDACLFLGAVAERLGKRRYDISISARDVRDRAVGSRQYRVAKDLLSDARHDLLGPDDFVTMVDTDYHMTREQFSQYAGHDIGIYALRPNGLRGSTTDSVWGFISPTTVVEEVAGNATYQHQVWDWGKDMVVLSRGLKTYIYDPVVFEVSDCRIVVVLLLARTLRLPIPFANWLVPGLKAQLPSRMEVFIHGKFIVGSFGRPGDRRIHVISADQYGGETSIKVRPDTFRALSIASTIPNSDRPNTKLQLLPSDVQKITRNCDDNPGEYGCYVLSAYFTTSYRPMQFCNYQSRGALTLESGSPTTVVAGPPLVGGGCGPTASSNNEHRAIEARIVGVANDNSFPEDLVIYAGEFVDLVIPRAGVLAPAGMPELRLAQNKPTQQSRRLQEDKHLPDRSNQLRTTSFQKKESYVKPGDPRIINQVPTDHTNRLCCYSMALKPLLKKHRWFAVCMSPLQLAKSIQGMQKKCGAQLIGGDYSRMDGRTSVAYRRNVLEPLYIRAFAQEYRSEISSLLRKEERARTRTRKFGARAITNGANLSGSGVTTDLNTLDAAFNEYAARRRLGQQPDVAFKKLGLYFGDDSLVDPTVFDTVVEVATATGMQLERETVPEDAGPGYAVFLSRVYPDIRTSLASHPVVVRSLRKLCTIQCSPNVDRADQLMRLRFKVDAVLVTDQHVPVLAAYARALKRILKLDGIGWHESESVEKATYTRKAGQGPYPYDDTQVTRDLLVQSVAQGLGISVNELLLLERRLDAAKTVEDLPSVPGGTGAEELPSWADWVPTETTA